MSSVKHIGTLEGKVLLFGGVYSNLEALRAMRVWAEQQSIPSHNIICTGDIVGYCAEPEQCLQLTKEWGIYTIAGNVELNLVDNAEDCGCDFTEGSRCDGFSKQWYPYAQSKVTPDSLAYIAQIPEFISFDFAGKTCFVLHGSIDNTSEFIFASTDKRLKSKIIQQAEADVVIAGHSGLPFAQEIEGKLWLNPGVIGMPANDGTQRVWYAVLDASTDIRYSVSALQYDHISANQKILENPLPASYAETLLTGLWDNMEILPLSERTQQGVPIAEIKNRKF
jgi:predicted phosphodiesterase